MRILVVEDEPDLLSVLVQALREEGYAVDAAADGEEGLFKAESAEYDAIVLDVMLPRIDGFEVLHKLRMTRKTPVLMLTARVHLKDKVRGLDGGADDYVTKPVDLEELSARLRALIRRAHGNASPVMQIGAVTVNLSARTVAVNGEPVSLSSREYAVLEVLILNRSRIVTRTQLYEHLYDEMETPLSNLVDVHVSNLRRKLGFSFVATHRGQGYSIDL